MELLALVGRALAFLDLGDLVEVAEHLGADARGVAVPQTGAVEILGEEAALLGGGGAEAVQVEKMTEGHEEHGIGKQAGNRDTEVALQVVDGGENRLAHAGPSLRNGATVEPEDIALADAAAEVGGDALEDGDRRNGLEGGIGEAFHRIVIAALKEFLVFFLEVEIGSGIEGFRDHDLEEGEGSAASVDAGKDVAGDIDAVFGDFDNGEIVAGERGLAGVDFLPVVC